MALLERVSTLLRANINDLIDKAEDPEKTLRQLLLDMENQLLQVKTQVAIAIADQHMLEKKKREHDEAAAAWQRKAEIAVGKGRDDLARAALDRGLSHQQLAAGFAQQIEDQRTEAEIMRANYGKLQQKVRETEGRCEMLLAQNRRARAVSKANLARAASSEGGLARSLEKMRMKVLADEVTNSATRRLLDDGAPADSASDPLASDPLEDRFRRMDREDRIESLLNELKERQSKTA
jgi:phage shock protein A